MAESKVAMVTGGTRGIGKAITLALAESGVHVCAGYLSNSAAAESMRDEAQKLGYSISIHQMDVGHPEDCVRFFNEAVNANGHVDYLINNAGINIDRTVRRMTIDEWHAVMRINISGCFYMVKAVVEHMVERGAYPGSHLEWSRGSRLRLHEPSRRPSVLCHGCCHSSQWRTGYVTTALARLHFSPSRTQTVDASSIFSLCKNLVKDPPKR